MLSWIVIVAIFVLIVAIFQKGQSEPEPKAWSAFVQMLDQGNIESMVVYDDGRIIAKKKSTAGDAYGSSGEVITRAETALDGNGFARINELASFRDNNGQLQYKAKVEFKKTNNMLFNVIVNAIPYLLVLGLLWFLFFRGR